MHFSRDKRSSRGDTIVEVLIAIAVVSSVLAGAFSVTQKSAQAVRSSQERGEMLQLLKGQVEQVRAFALAADDISDPIYVSGYFCISESSGDRVDMAPSANINDHTTWTNCRNFGSSNLYNVAISYNASDEVFTAIGKWDRIGGGINQVQLTYRILPTPLVTGP